MTRLELLEAILFSDEYQIQDTKTLLIYVLERLDELEDNIDCLNEKIDELLLKI
jgi:ubiquinone biosynthesis protein UbiJ